MRKAAPGFMGKVATLTSKDLRVEWRSRDTLPSMVAFAVAVTVLLAFVLPASSDPATPVDVPIGTAPLGRVLAGFFWVIVFFAGLIAFARTYEAEREDGALDALVLLPLDRSGLWLAKCLSNLVLLVALEVLLAPIFAILFGVAIWDVWPTFLLITLLVDIGFVAIGTLFSSIAVHTRSRDLILPVLAVPALVPVFIAAVELTTTAFEGGGIGDVTSAGWFAILATFDVVAAAVGALAFDAVVG